MEIKKILIVRFSSIGDIVLTTPVIRCVKRQLPEAQLHFVTKEVFKPLLQNNPYIDKIHCIKNEISDVLQELKAEKFDLVIDLHRNLRSLRLKQALKAKSYSFDKINARKFMAVNFKMIKLLPAKHIVDRYFEAITELGVKNDYMGLDYFISDTDNVDVSSIFGTPVQKFVALVVGGSYYTKKIPLNKLKEICANVRLPLVLLGGKEDQGIAEELKKEFPSVINTCGQLSINQSASLVKQAEWVITSDTGLMHIAAAFKKKLISVWGNTIPEFGMYPYFPSNENLLLEVKDLKCRPCSKLGYAKCPLGHFKCMNDIDFSFVSELD